MKIKRLVASGGATGRIRRNVRFTAEYDLQLDGRLRRIYWEARLMVDGKQRVRAYTIQKYGYAGA